MTISFPCARRTLEWPEALARIIMPAGGDGKADCHRPPIAISPARKHNQGDNRLEPANNAWMGSRSVDRLADRNMQQPLETGGTLDHA